MKPKKIRVVNSAVYQKIIVDTSELDEVLSKIERLHNALKEAKSLADELTSKMLNLEVEVQI